MSTYAISAPSPSSSALSALLDVVGMEDLEITESNNGIQLAVTTTNALTGIPTTVSATTWTSATRLLASSTPGLMGDGSLKATAMVEAWIDTGASTLVPILQTDKNDQALKAVVESFAAKLEKHLFGSDQTYLVGDVPTAADVLVALWLAETCAKLQISELPQQTFRWCMTLCHHALLKSYAPSKLPEQGKASPSEKPAAPAKKAAETTTKAASPADAPSAAAPSGGDDEGDNIVLSKLKEWKLKHSVYSHKLSMTADDLVANVPIPGGDSHTKNLFLKDKKHGMFLVTVSTDSKVNTKELGKQLGLQGKVNLRLADEATLLKALGCKKGCVGPLAIVNDSAGEVTLVLDQALLSKANIHSHPLKNDASVKMTPSALQEYVTKAGHEPTILEFESAAGETAPAAAEKPKPPPVESKPAPTAGKTPADAPKKEKNKQNKKTGQKGETLLALQWKKTENFAMWYSDVIVLSEMISYYDISGCYILRPWSFKIWELVQAWFNVKIQDLGVENAYFPMFVSKDRLETEKDHVEGFSPEVAWVTKSGDGELAQPIAVRPTSETVMYPAFSDWIRSHRDLPLKLNQWCNIVRWEFKDPTPFLRTREFLWQEGHTAHATLEEADAMVRQILALYQRVYQELLAVPVIPGNKTEKEKFAGGYMTTTVEAYIPTSGRAIQGATSHNLGQNFGKMFEINYQDNEGKLQIPWQTSWGLTTRTLGVMIMVHGDDTGLVLPPRVAPIQAVIIPIITKKLTTEQAGPYCTSILESLKAAGVRSKYDDRTIYNPGWKYNHWEQKGVPIRIEVGPRDIEQKSVRVVMRLDGNKFDLPLEGLAETIKEKLEEAQQAMFEKAKAVRDSHLVQVTEWKDFVPNLEKSNLVLTPWCGGEHQDWEEWVKDKSKAESLEARGEESEDARAATSVAAKTLCMPFEQPPLPEGTKCIASGMPAKCWVLWGRSY